MAVVFDDITKGESFKIKVYKNKKYAISGRGIAWIAVERRCKNQWQFLLFNSFLCLPCWYLSGHSF